MKTILDPHCLQCGVRLKRTHKLDCPLLDNFHGVVTAEQCGVPNDYTHILETA